MLDVLGSIVGSVLGMEQAEDQNQTLRENAQTAANAAFPWKDWREQNLLPRIVEHLKKQQQGDEQLGMITNEFMPLFQRIQQTAANPNISRLRDISLNALTDDIDNPARNPRFADSERYAGIMRQLVENPGSFIRTPYGEAMMKQGLDDVESKASARGLLGSSDYLDQLQEKARDIGKKDYFDFLTTLGGMQTNRYNQFGQDFARDLQGFNAGNDAITNAYRGPMAQLNALTELGKLLANQKATWAQDLNAMTSTAGLTQGSPAHAAQAYQSAGNMALGNTANAQGQLSRSLTNGLQSLYQNYQNQQEAKRQDMQEQWEGAGKYNTFDLADTAARSEAKADAMRYAWD
jgi:hypothetical protein